MYNIVTNLIFTINLLNEIIPLFAEVLCMDHFDGLFIA